MQLSILKLSKDFVAIPSHAQNPKALEEILRLALSTVSEFTCEHFASNGYQSALIYNSQSRPKKFKIILNAHLDITPGKNFQYNPKVRDNKLIGVGALDMKANAACLIKVFKDVADKVDYPLALQLTTDEELGGFDGTKYQIGQEVRADFVIAGETTQLDIVNKAKGILWLKISTKGKTAHGAYPWKGENAILKMTNFLNALGKAFPLPRKEQWITTINVSKVRTDNQTFNKIPDTCEVWLDIRYIPEEKDLVIKKINKIAGSEFSIKTVMSEPALFVTEKNKYIQSLQTIGKKHTNKEIALYGANGSSDARHFTAVGCDGIEFGAIGGGIGTDEEWIDIKSLEKYYAILKEFLLTI